MFSRTPSPTNGDDSASSVNPMKGLQMAEFAFNEEELPDNILANNKLEDKLKSLTVSDKDIRSVINDLSEPAEVLTEDEVEEEIEEDVGEEGVVANNVNTTNRHRSLSNDNKSPPTSVSDAENYASKQKSPTKSQHSYTADFSSGSEIKTQSDRSHSQTYSEQKSSRSSRTSRSSRSSRSSQSSRSSRSSRSSQSSRSTRRSKSSDRSRSRRSNSDYRRSKVLNVFMLLNGSVVTMPTCILSLFYAMF